MEAKKFNMRNYLIKNCKPILVGFTIALIMVYYTQLVSDIIIKIALIGED